MKKLIKDERKLRVLQFLASGHAYTTEGVIGELLDVTRSSARRITASLEADGALSSKIFEIIRESGVPRKVRIFRITNRGLALADAPLDTKAFGLGKVNPAYVPHRLLGQRACIVATKHNWKEWTPELALRRQATKNAKVPDAVAVDPGGRKIAIEIERNPKTLERYRAIVALYKSLIRAGKIDGVAYLVSAGFGKRIERLLTAAGGGAAFMIFEADEWPHTPISRTIRVQDNASYSQPEEPETGASGGEMYVELESQDQFSIGFNSGRYYALDGERVVLKSWNRYACVDALKKLGADEYDLTTNSWIDPPDTAPGDEVCGTVSRPLENSDHWDDNRVCDRDLLDLRMMKPSLLRKVMAKAEGAWVSSILRTMERAFDRPYNHQEWLERCQQVMLVDLPKARLWQRLRALRRAFPPERDAD